MAKQNVVVERMRRKKKSMTAKTKTTGTASPVARVTRDIAAPARVALFVRAGGRCEFDGCNRYLLEHHVTLKEGNFAQMAHIVAFSKDGPRGQRKRQPQRINGVENLMLLCQPCHKLIDDDPETYPVLVLEGYKQQHEERIHHLTGLRPDLKTTIVQLRCRIAGQTVAIPLPQVTQAIAPRYPVDKKGYVIDLTAFDNDGVDFVNAAQREIEQKIARLYENGMDLAQTQHISLFAMAPIPLLIFLGSRLSNKVEIDLFQRHRDTEDWTWKTDGNVVEYVIEKRRDGTDISKVALLVSLSGKVSPDSLPAEIDGRFTVYELTLVDRQPTPTFLRGRADLANFKQVYQTALRMIGAAHAQLQAMSIFPAVPAPIAVLCGRERLPKVDPKLLVYDYDKRSGGFTFSLEVN